MFQAAFQMNRLPMHARMASRRLVHEQTKMGPNGGPMLQKPAVGYGRHQMDKKQFSKSLLSMLRAGGFNEAQLAKVDGVVMDKMDVDNRYFVQPPETTWGLSMQENPGLLRQGG